MVEEVEGYGIASVYTPESNRGRGYAQHMMRLLHWVLAPVSLMPPEFPTKWGTPPERVNNFGKGAFSVLYSDVGRRFYSHCGPTGGSDGWTVTDSASTIWKVSDLESKLSEQHVRSSWTWLDEVAVNDLWEADARLIKDEISKNDPRESRILCTFLPNNGVSDFQLKRMEPYWRQLPSVPEHFGITSSVPTAGYCMKPETVFATWTIDVRPPGPKSLILTRIRARGASDLKVVLSPITEYCKQFRLEKIEVWNLDEKLHDAARRLGGVTFERDVQLASLRFYRKEAMAWKWINNEKLVDTASTKRAADRYTPRFCWC